MKEVLVLRDLECIKAIAHPRRIDILKIFDSMPLSAKQLSQMLDEPHAKINYHIKTLYKVGILELVEEKIKSGIVEKYYYPTAKNIVLGNNILKFCLDKEDKDDKVLISKFENMTELFYKAAEEEILEEENIMEYSDITLSEKELIELNNSIKAKIDDILENRNNEQDEKMYDLTMVAIPKSVEFNT